MSLQTRIHQRMNDLDETLSLYYEKLKMFQDEVVITSSIDAKFSVKKRIQKEILPYIQKYETEYANLLANEVIESEMSNEEAEATVVEVQEAIAIVKNTAQGGQSDALAQSVENVQKALDAPTTAKGKLKAAIPIIPGIISYQLELDAHSTLMNLWEGLKAKLKQ